MGIRNKGIDRGYASEVLLKALSGHPLQLTANTLKNKLFKHSSSDKKKVFRGDDTLIKDLMVVCESYEHERDKVQLEVDKQEKKNYVGKALKENLKRKNIGFNICDLLIFFYDRQVRVSGVIKSNLPVEDIIDKAVAHKQSIINAEEKAQTAIQAYQAKVKQMVVSNELATVEESDDKLNESALDLLDQSNKTLFEDYHKSKFDYESSTRLLTHYKKQMESLAAGVTAISEDYQGEFLDLYFPRNVELFASTLLDNLDKIACQLMSQLYEGLIEKAVMAAPRKDPKFAGTRLPAHESDLPTIGEWRKPEIQGIIEIINDESITIESFVKRGLGICSGEEAIEYHAKSIDSQHPCQQCRHAPCPAL